MTLFGYIDESGTMPKDMVLAVGLVLFGGKNKAARTHLNVVKALYPQHANNKQELDKCTLHMHEMFEDSITQTARVLAQEPVRAHISYRYHDNETENFNGFFKHYKSMVQQVIYKAMEQSDDELVITIGEMGANRKYDKALCLEFESVADLFADRNRGAYRKVSCKTASAADKGVQLADFYTGATRKMLLAPSQYLSAALSSPYDQLERQISHESIW